jgi:hypothetical protein
LKLISGIDPPPGAGLTYIGKNNRSLDRGVRFPKLTILMIYPRNGWIVYPGVAPGLAFLPATHYHMFLSECHKKSSSRLLTLTSARFDPAG